MALLRPVSSSRNVASHFNHSNGGAAPLPRRTRGNFFASSRAQPESAFTTASLPAVSKSIVIT
jgi:hypothetical protein